MSKVLPLFISWRILLFLIAICSIFFIPTFGEKFPYYREVLVSTGLPNWIWGFGNFDGVHYLRIAEMGYFAQYSQTFFPLYPISINVVCNYTPLALLSSSNCYFMSGLIISNFFFILSLSLLYKLFLLDYKKNIVFKVILLILVFPTSFYFGAIYSESLFLFLTVSSLLALRKRNFVLSGVFAALASATRIFGVLLFLVIAWEVYQELKSREILVKTKQVLFATLGLLLAPLGTLIYMIYLKISFNDALYFLNAQPAFGAERSDKPFILLPQVFYRYVKILHDVPVNSTAFFNASLELFMTLAVLILIVLSYKKVRTSYLLFSIGVFVLPTLTGTLSSMPRYVLFCFLLFPVLANIPSKYYYTLVCFCVLIGAILVSLFIRGFWVS